MLAVAIRQKERKTLEVINKLVFSFQHIQRRRGNWSLVVEARCDCFKSKTVVWEVNLNGIKGCKGQLLGLGTGAVNNRLMLSLSFFLDVLFRLA